MNKNIPPELSLKELNQILSQTIKCDDANKQLLFFVMLSAYTEDSQINATLNAPSSSGKTYLTQQVAKFFPKEDLIILNNATPTALFYGKSEPDPNDEAKRRINMERKILILLEQPNFALQTNLRSLLSHDSKESVYQRTNRNKKGANRAEEIIIRGFPATVFSSASQHLDEQEATRALMLSPEISQEKIDSAIDSILQKSADPATLSQIENNPARIALKNRIRLIRDMNIDDIRTPSPQVIKQKFYAFVSGALKSRHMRDVEHLTQLIKSIALLNIWHRREGSAYHANNYDMNEAFRLWSGIAKTQELNVTPYIYDIYEKYIVGAHSQLPSDQRQFGVSRKTIIQYHHQKTKTLLSDDFLRRTVLPALDNSGLISLLPHPTDRRQLLVLPHKTIGT